MKALNRGHKWFQFFNQRNPIKFLAYDTNNLLLLLVRNERSPSGVSFVAVALDFQVFFAQTWHNSKLQTTWKKSLLLRHKLKKPTKCRNDVLSQSGASIFAARPIRNEQFCPLFRPISNFSLYVISCNRGYFVLIFLSWRAQLLTPGWFKSENTRCWLAEPASCWFLHCVQKQWVLWGVVCAKNTWKSSAAARKEIPAGQCSCVLRETAEEYLCQKLKSWNGLIFVWLRNWNHSWRPSTFTSLLLLKTNDNRA